MRRLLSIISFLLAAAYCSYGSAIARGNVRDYSGSWTEVPGLSNPAGVLSAYRIGPSDKLAISVLQLPDLPKEYSVDGKGNLTMPLIGSVHAAGLTKRDLEALLKAEYRAKYLQAPEIQVGITSALGDRVTIEGAINQPGVYPLNGVNSLVGAIGLAQGLDDTAIPSRVAVFRVIKGRRIGAAFDLKRIRRGLDPDPKIYGNDLIIVDGSRLKQTFADIMRGISIGSVLGR